MPIEPTFTNMKANTPEEVETLRRIFARHSVKYSECPCGYFYKGARCPDEKCKLWKQANGTKRFKLYAHADDETAYAIGRDKVGLDGDALDNFSRWGYELEFEVDIDMETGNTKLLTVDGHKISPVKG
jgi:hypothetical protein